MYDHPLQGPQPRLRHLRGLQVRNLVLPDLLPVGAVQLGCWSRAVAQGTPWPLVYTSPVVRHFLWGCCINQPGLAPKPKVVGDNNPDFGDLTSEALQTTEDSLIHGQASGRLHVRLYAWPADTSVGLASTLPEFLPGSEGGCTTEPRGSTQEGGRSTGDYADSAQSVESPDARTKREHAEQFDGLQQVVDRECAGDNDAPAAQRREGNASEGRRHSGQSRSAADDDGSVDGRSDDYETADSEDELDGAGSARGSPENRHFRGAGGLLEEPELIFAADIKLRELQLLGADLALVDVWFPPNTLILELPDGYHAFPTLQPADADATHALTLTSPFGEAELQALTSQAPSSGAMAVSELFACAPSASLLAAANGIEADRTNSSLFRAFVQSDLELWHARPLGATTAPATTSSGRKLMPASASNTWQAAATESSAGPTADIDARKLLGGIVALSSSQVALEAAQQQRQQWQDDLEQMLAKRERWRERHRRLVAAHSRLSTARRRCERAAQCREALWQQASLARRIISAQAAALCSSLRGMEAAAGRLGDATALLGGEHGAGWLLRLHRQLVARRCRMAVQLASAYDLRFRTVTLVEAPAGGFLEERLERSWFTGTSSAGATDDDSGSQLEANSAVAESIGSRIREVARLCIGGLELDPTLGRRGIDGVIGWEADRAASALGYATHVTERLSKYLEVPLRYPLEYGASTSAVQDHPPPAGSFRRVAEDFPSNGTDVVSRPSGWLQRRRHAVGDETRSDDLAVQFPLYLDGHERTRFAYAIFLLNKDIETLLNAHGISTLGPSHVLQNLHALISSAASGLPRQPHLSSGLAV